MKKLYQFTKTLTDSELDLIRFHLHKIWELELHKSSYENKMEQGKNQIKQFEKEIQESKKELIKLGFVEEEK